MKKIFKALELTVGDLIVSGILIGCTLYASPITDSSFKLNYYKPKLNYYKPKIENIQSNLEIKLKESSADTIKSFSQEEIETLTLMTYLEVGICPLKEKEAVAYTAINRLKNGYGNNLIDVIRAPNQYHGFDLSDEILIKMKGKAKKYDLRNWEECEKAVENILYNNSKDPTNGATHYFNSAKIDSTSWNMKKMDEIGKIQVNDRDVSVHSFYKERI